MEGVGSETHVYKITNVSYLFFYMALGFNDFDAGNPLIGPFGRVGPENLDVCGPKWHSQNSLDFQGPPLSVALVMDDTKIKSRIKISTYRAI